MPRKKIPVLAIKTLAGIASQEAAPAAARVAASVALMDRGWGRAPQAIVGKDDGNIHVTIRQIAEGGGNDQKLELQENALQ